MCARQLHEQMKVRASCVGVRHETGGSPTRVASDGTGERRVLSVIAHAAHHGSACRAERGSAGAGRIRLSVVGSFGGELAK